MAEKSFVLFIYRSHALTSLFLLRQEITKTITIIFSPCTALNLYFPVPPECTVGRWGRIIPPPGCFDQITNLLQIQLLIFPQLLLSFKALYNYNWHHIFLLSLPLALHPLFNSSQVFPPSQPQCFSPTVCMLFHANHQHIYLTILFSTKPLLYCVQFIPVYLICK